MAKQRRAREPVAKQRRARNPAAKPAAPAPAGTLSDLTRQGLDVLQARQKTLADAIERLKADYERLLKRRT